MVRNLFTEFDKMCIKFKIYKVYTIGDCYVALGFNNANKRKPVQEAKNLVKMGLSMIDIIRNVRKIINFKGLDMRIGIHTVSFFPKNIIKKILNIFYTRAPILVGSLGQILLGMISTDRMS
jgi:hypothetical protein